MSALYDLVAKELSRIGVRAQDEVQDHNEWMKISDSLSEAWRALYAGRYEDAAEHGKAADRLTEKTIEAEAQDYIWDRPVHME